MEEVLRIIYSVLNTSVNLLMVLLFYLSIKKSFLREGKSRVKLFLLTLITHPMVFVTGTLALSMLIAGLAYSLITKTDFASAMDMVDKIPVMGFITIFFGGVLSVIAAILLSNLVGKWLKVSDTSLVTFIYLMFAVIFGLSGGRNYGDTAYAVISPSLMGSISSAASVVAVWLLFRFVIRSLSGLKDRKRQINIKVFLMPPTIFLPIYYAFDFIAYTFGGYTVNIVVQIASMMILYLFIWAFYVIINNMRAANEALDAKDEVKTLSVEVMEALARTIDAKDKYTNGHSVRVAKYSRMIAEKMALPAQTCEDIYYMGLLHDIGKIGVPNEIINKPSRLSDDEYKVIKTHPGIGFDILSQINSRPDLAKGAHWHHERYDGKGYPDGIAGDAIPLEARIIAVADTYDAMTSNRSYRQYLPQETVRAEIKKNSGTQFDPAAVENMLAIMDEDKDYVLHE